MVFSALKLRGCFAITSCTIRRFCVEVSQLLYVHGADILLNIIFQFIINRLYFVVDFCEIATEFVNIEMDFLL
jgi:hypothetical protein